MKLLPETIVFVIINVFDAVYTAIGIHMGLLAEANPFMLLVIEHSGLMGLCVFKMLWLALLLAIFEYSYHRLTLFYPDPQKMRKSLRRLARIGIVVYVFWWSVGGWILFSVSPAFLGSS